MTHWQLSKDNGFEHSYLIETDGLNPSLIAIPVGALGSVVHNAPKDYDLLLVNQPLFAGGKLFSRFADKDGNMVEIHEWRQEGVAGLGAYLFSDRFVDKVFKHIAENGADMVDAWLVDDMCSRNAVDAHGKFLGFDEETQRKNGGKKAVAPVLRCYHAIGVQQVVGGKDPNPKVFPPGTPASAAAASVGNRNTNGKNGALGLRENNKKKNNGWEGEAGAYLAEKLRQYREVKRILKEAN